VGGRRAWHASANVGGVAPSIGVGACRPGCRVRSAARSKSGHDGLTMSGRILALLLAMLGLVSALSLSCASHPLAPQDAARLVEPPPDEQAGEVLAGLHVAPEQKRAIAALGAKLRAELRGTAHARDELVDVLLTSLRAGRVDRARVDPVVRAVVTAIDEVKPQLLGDLDELHALLTPEQRATLVEGLEKKRRAESEGESEGKRRLKQIVEALDIGVGQQLEMASAAKDRFGKDEKRHAAKLKEQLEAALESFKSDSFKATELEVVRGPVVEYWLGVIISLFEIVVPILDEDQRLTLVAMAEKMLGAAPAARAAKAAQ